MSRNVLGVMRLPEILRALDEGLAVQWQNHGYVVERAAVGGACVIRSLSTGHCICLTWADGITLNGKESEFFIGEGTTLLPRSWRTRARQALRSLIESHQLEPSTALAALMQLAVEDNRKGLYAVVTGFSAYSPKNSGSLWLHGYRY